MTGINWNPSVSLNILGKNQWGFFLYKHLKQFIVTAMKMMQDEPQLLDTLWSDLSIYDCCRPSPPFRKRNKVKSR